MPKLALTAASNAAIASAALPCRRWMLTTSRAACVLVWLLPVMFAALRAAASSDPLRYRVRAYRN